MESAAWWERMAALATWAIVAGVGLVTISQAVGYDGFRTLAVVQSLTPYMIPLVSVPAVVALWRSWAAVGVVASLVGLALLLLCLPIVFPGGQRQPIEDADGTSVAAVNLMYANPLTDEIADDLLERELDVVVFTEFTPEHAAVLRAHPLFDDLAFREGKVRDFASGIAVWSRYPIDVRAAPDTNNPSIDLTVEGPDGAFRVLAVHPPTPVFDFAGWIEDLDLIGDATAQSDTPTLAIGDFNASYWHPAFRDLLGRGLTDAHTVDRRGLSPSWPTEKAIPPFVRLDHALVNDALVSIGIDDFRVPGSDHAGLVVTVVPAG